VTSPTITETIVAHFFVSGEPQPQPRPRARAIPKRVDGKVKWIATIYNPSDADEWREAVKRQGGRHAPASPLDCALGLEADFFMPRPQYLYEKKYPRGPIQFLGAPDTENLIKSTKDAMTEAGFWTNDSRVCSETVRKWYHAVGERPGAIIAVYTRTAGDEQLGLEMPEGPLAPVVIPAPRPHVVCNKCGFVGEPLNDQGEHYRKTGERCGYSGVRLQAKCPTCRVRPVDPDGDGQCAVCFGAEIEAGALAEEQA
jgi:Holliday junction resolvase RusA-like endonuclease